MYSKYVLAIFLAVAGVNAQFDEIISSIAGQISAGLVSGRRDSVAESQAKSEVDQIMNIVTNNSDMKNLFSEGAGLVLGGINSKAVVSFASAAQASLTALEGSNDGKSLDGLISSHGSDLDVTKAFTIIESNLSPVLGLIVPQISSLSGGDQTVASAVNGLTSAAISLVGKFGLLDNAAATSAASSAASSVSSAVASATSSAASATSAASSVASSAASSASSAVKSSSAAPTDTASGTTSSTITQINGQNKNSIGLVVAGAAAAASVFFL